MIRYSTGTIQNLAAGQSLKEIFLDSILNFYSEAQPASANSPMTGTKLLAVSNASGAFVAGTRSTTQKDTITITSATEGQTQIATLDGTAYTYTNIAGDTTTTAALALAALLNASGVVYAYSIAEKIAVVAKFPGVAFTLVMSGTGSPSSAATVANARSNGLIFGVSTAGTLAKEVGIVWSGVGLATDYARSWRLSANAVDDNSESTTLCRIDGNCGTADTNDAKFETGTTKITLGLTHIVDSFDIPFPSVSA